MILECPVPTMSLVGMVYSQSRPAPDSRNQSKRGFHGKLFRPSQSRNGTRQSATGSPHEKPRAEEPPGCRGKAILATPRRQHPGTGPQQPNSTPSRHAELDQSTYKWKAWTHFQQDNENDQRDLTLYKITQDTFRKLSAQVREVNQQISKYHKVGFKSLYTHGDRAVPTVRPSQLAASLPRRPPSIGPMPAGDGSPVRQELSPRCTPVERSQRRRPNSSVAIRPKQHQLSQRPKSTSAVSGGRADFDRLTPRVIGALSDGKPTNGVGGDPHSGPFDIVSSAAKPAISDESSEEEEQPEDRVYQVRAPPNFDLPPEDLDVDHHRALFRHRSSSAGKKQQEPYPEALSEPYCYLDLLELSLLKEDWRHAVRAAPDGVEEKLIDRLIEMERLQTASEEWERGQRLPAPPKRAASAVQRGKSCNPAAALPAERARSALARPWQSRNCSPDCLQPLCAGDCERRRGRPAAAGCPRCKQDYCQGSCAEFGYHLHIRQPREREDEPPPPRPKSCKSCASGRASARKSAANANTAVLGRPKSAFATFSSARQMVRKPRPISAAAAAAAAGVTNGMASLELSTAAAGGDRAPLRPKTATASLVSRVRGHGRDSALPGKSFASQRRHTLTDEPISTSAARMNSKPRRVKSARLKARPKRNTRKR